MTYEGMDNFTKRKEICGELRDTIGAIRMLQVHLDNIIHCDIGNFAYIDTYIAACRYAMDDLLTARERLHMAEAALKAGLPRES